MPRYLASTLYVATETNVSLISLNMSCAERNKAECIVYDRRRMRENAYHSALQCGMQTKITLGRFFKHLIKPPTTYTKFAIPWDLTVFLSQLQLWLRLVLCFIAASYESVDSCTLSCVDVDCISVPRCHQYPVQPPALLTPGLMPQDFPVQVLSCKWYSPQLPIHVEKTWQLCCYIID